MSESEPRVLLLSPSTEAADEFVHLLDQIATLLNSLDLSDESHLHKCGYGELRGEKNPQGCGHIWRHGGLDREDTERYLHAHLCPVCKSGPWPCIYFGELLAPPGV